MTSHVNHILLTRFNLPSAGVESTIRSRDGWLQGRVALFERYCLPSVIAQREQNVHWLVYFDPASPDWLKSWVDATCGDTFVPIYRTKVEHADLVDDMDQLIPSKARTLITTNLDNDDGLGLNLVRRLQECAWPRPKTAVYFARGLIKSHSGLYLRTDPENAFCSVRETWDEPMTCWKDWHNRLHLWMPVEVVTDEPHWLQVVHATNVSNRVRGRLVSPGLYRRDFIGIDEIPIPTRSELWRDRLIRMPVRGVRDGVRMTARRAAVAALGKEGVNQVKATFAGEPGRAALGRLAPFTHLRRPQ